MSSLDRINGETDLTNSTSKVLGAAGVYTGQACLCRDCAAIYVNVYSDQSSATDGLEIQQSTDGVNWDFSDTYTITGGDAEQYTINPSAAYYRIVYTNGATPQTEFRLQVNFKYVNVVASSHRIQDEISNEDDAQLIKSVLTGENGGGTFKNVKVTTDGNLSISDNSSGLSIAAGNVTGISFVHKFGFAPDFDTTDGTVTIWDGADDDGINEMQYNYSATANIDSLISTDNGDTVDIEVQGLDTSGLLTNQTVTLTGQTRAALTTSLTRVFRLKNVGATDLVGTVSCYVNSSTTAGVVDDSGLVRALIDNGNNQTLMSIYTIPNNKTGYMRDWFASTAGASKTTNYLIELYARPYGQVFQLKHKSSISETGNSYIQHKYEEPEVFSALTDIELRVTATAGGVSGASISGGFDIVLEDV